MTPVKPHSSRFNWILIGAVLLIAAFLLGFIPQYLKNSRTMDEVKSRDQRIEQLNREAHQSHLRDLASLLFLEVSRKNYGTAGQNATALFDGVRAEINNSADATLKSGLQTILAQRDSIVAKLAAADPTVGGDAQNILDRLFQLTYK